MKFLKTNKYLSPLLFLINLGLVVLVVAGVREHEVPGSTYLYLVLLVVTGIAFLSLNLLSQKEEKIVSMEKIIENSEADELEKEEENQVELTTEINYGEWVDGLLKKAKKENLTVFSESLLALLAKEFEVVQALYFSLDKKSGNFTKIADYAYYSDVPPREFMTGETISGQVAKNRQVMKIADIPESYITVLSGLGSSSPSNLVIVPVVIENESVGVIELAFFTEPGEKEILFFEELVKKAGSIAGKFITEKSSEQKK